MQRNDVVQFLKGHKWCGCVGIVSRAQGEKILVCVPMPSVRAMYDLVYTCCHPEEVAVIGRAALCFGEDT